jgi:5-methylcytosine-specific restriction endonuclease McrA
MNYNEQLDSQEWKSKREEIILRDNSRCTECNIERNQILGLSSKFGIKDYENLKAEIFSVIKSNNETQSIFIIKNNFLSPCYYVGKSEQTPDISELKYASQWIERKNLFELKETRYICFDKDTQIKEMYDLNVHHKYYILEKMAWEYKNDALITLCASCHKEEHSKKQIPVYNEKGEFQHNAENCPKCSGAGVLSEYSYYMNGVCFKCMGTGNINF